MQFSNFLSNFLVKILFFEAAMSLLCVFCSRPRTGERTPPEKLSGKMAWGDDSGFVLELVT